MFKRSPKSRFRSDLQSAARSGGRKKSFYLASVALPLVVAGAAVAFFEFGSEAGGSSAPQPVQEVAMLAPAEAVADGDRLTDAAPEEQVAVSEAPAPPSVTAKAARPAAPAPAGPAPLSAADPRWESVTADNPADADRPPQNETASRQLAAALQEQGSAMSVEIDDATTAAVPPDSLAPVEVAETADEVAMLEASVAASQGASPDAAFVVPNSPEADEEIIGATDQQSEGTADGLMPATTSGYVNFRSGPSNDAETIEILPSGVAIEASDDCPHFCRARHEGRDGYIYRSYIAFPGEEPRRQAARQPSEEAEATAPAETAETVEVTPEANSSQTADEPSETSEDRRNITFFDLIARD